MKFIQYYGDQALTQLDKLIDLALEEDIGAGDATTQALIAKESKARFVFNAREALTVAALFLVPRIYAALARKMGVLPPRSIASVEEAESVQAGQALMEVTGNAQLLLTGERVALNFLQRCCGVATLTARYRQEMKNENIELRDTRKTLPGYRYLDKYSVRCGGGINHRLRLDDAVMIKDNHLSLETNIAAAVQHARSAYSQLPIQVECDTLEQVKEALAAKPEWLLLDNMPPEILKEAVALSEGSNIKLEASGGVTLDTIAEIAQTGVDAISVGALTHSAVAVDIGLDREMG